MTVSAYLGEFLVGSTAKQSYGKNDNLPLFLTRILEEKK
jgi:hypothetical protein